MPNQDPQQYKEAMMFEARRAAETAAETIANAGLEVVDRVERAVGVPLVPPTQRRADTPLPDGLVAGEEPTAEEQARLDAIEQQVRPALGEIGIGRVTDIDVVEAGLSEAAQQNLEGGQPHKMEAELRVALRSGTGDIVLTATNARALGTGEPASLQHCLDDKRARAGMPQVDGSDATTEYDAGYLLLTSEPEFVPLPEVQVVGTIGLHGEVNPDDAREGEFGTLKWVGHINGRRVFTLDVPRQQAGVDGKTGRPQFTQPTAGALMGATSEILGNHEVAVVTSATYYPSRVADVALATLDARSQGSDTRFGVAAYCPRTLAEVKGVAEPAVPGLAHMLGEAHAAKRVFEALRAKVAGGTL